MPDPKMSMIDLGPVADGAAPPASESMPAASKEEGYEDEADGFAQDAFDAVTTGNAEAFKSAIRGLVESCM